MVFSGRTTKIFHHELPHTSIAETFHTISEKSFGLRNSFGHVQSEECPGTGITKLFRHSWNCFDPLTFYIFL